MSLTNEVFFDQVVFFLERHVFPITEHGLVRGRSIGQLRNSCAINNMGSRSLQVCHASLYVALSVKINRCFQVSNQKKMYREVRVFVF